LIYIDFIHYLYARRAALQSGRRGFTIRPAWLYNP